MPGFDTLKYVLELEHAGVPRAQAEGHARAFAAVHVHNQDQMATKHDIANMATKDDIANMATKDDIANMATKDDIANMATKDDIANMATKDDIANMATKDDIANMATKDDIANMATKQDIAEIQKDIARLDCAVHSLVTSMGWMKWIGTGTITICFFCAAACFEMLKRVSPAL